MSYEKYYPNGWQSGETGGTPITPEALNHIEAGILGCAQGGFGLGVLGTKATTLTNANDGTAIGWYRITSNTTNGVGAVALLRVDSTSENNLVQTAYAGGYSNEYYLIQRRYLHNGVWSAWEWENPPLVAGTEYRTTERFQGKPVFAKLVQLGDLPASASKSVSFNTSSSVTVVSFKAFAKSKESAVTQMMPLISNTGGVLAKVQVTNYNVVVYALSDLSSYEGYVIIKYTKG